MSTIDSEIFKQVLERFEPEEINPDNLESAIRKVSEWYANNKRRYVKLTGEEFHQYCIDVVLLFGFDLFEAPEYRSALGTYFGLRSAKKRAGYKIEERVEKIPRIGVQQGVTRDHISIQVTKRTLIRFRAGKEKGQLGWGDVLSNERKPDNREKIPPAIYQKAHLQAMMAMNQRRKND